jgi:hypothetical protein
MRVELFPQGMRYANVGSSTPLHRLAHNHDASCGEECDTRSLQGKQDSLLPDDGPFGLGYREAKFIRVPAKWAKGLRSLV